MTATSLRQWYETPTYERAAFADLRPGDLIHFPSRTWNGEPCGWNIQPHRVDRVEERATGVLFVWTPRAAFGFVMVCGDLLQAGVLRVKRSAEPVEPTPREVGLDDRRWDCRNDDTE
ncbi:hypothetical protein [Streptomyces phytophilus]|uniref:hypothetical protein n=1 Tax=Streptomyces phytophilus TaxID=722715 RepID=UPI0015EFE17F|nr:hypothetical protein [Streptomyces phytophilus]